MSLYAPPPSPSRGNVNSTPPIPHAPIGTQGDPPPLRSVAAVLMLTAVLASWPSALEPRLSAPNNVRVKIAPLTLTYGDAPPVNGPATPTEIATLVRLNIVDAPLVPRVPIATATLPPPPIVGYVPPHPTGWLYPAIAIAAQDPIEIEVVATFVIAPDNPDPPPNVGPITPVEYRLVVASWPTEYPPILRSPINAAVLPPPPIATYVPPNRFPDAIARAWQPPDVVPPPLLRSIVPTFAAVSQPAPVGPLTPTEIAKLVTLNQAPPPLPVQLLRSVVPTLPAVSQPPVRGVSSLLPIVATWAVTWDAQHAAPNAGWNVPPPQSITPIRFAAHIYAASQPPDPPPVQRVRSVVPTFPAVSQPPRRPPLSVAQLAVIGAWPQALEPRLASPNASRVPSIPPPRPAFFAFWLIHLNEQIGPTPQQPSPR